MADAVVLQELWVSLIGLLRSHLAALEISERLKGVLLEQTTATELELQSGLRKLNLNLDPQTGKGTWKYSQPGSAEQCGNWLLTYDALVRFEDASVAIDMELAVEEFAAKLAA
ncbi:MAG: hypothetical protein ACYC46_13965 [Acidobacteriaceae bacterium]